MNNPNRASQAKGQVGSKPKDRNQKCKRPWIVDSFIYNQYVFAKFWMEITRPSQLQIGGQEVAQIESAANFFSKKISPIKRQKWRKKGEIPEEFYNFLIEKRVIKKNGIPGRTKDRNIHNLIIDLDSSSSSVAKNFCRELLEDIAPTLHVVDKQLSSRNLKHQRNKQHCVGTGIERLFEALS